MKRWEPRARGKHQRGRKVANCGDCGDPIWKTDRSVITGADPLELLHYDCWKLRQLAQ